MNILGITDFNWTAGCSLPAVSMDDEIQEAMLITNKLAKELNPYLSELDVTSLNPEDDLGNFVKLKFVFNSGERDKLDLMYDRIKQLALIDPLAKNIPKVEPSITDISKVLGEHISRSYFKLMLFLTGQGSISNYREYWSCVIRSLENRRVTLEDGTTDFIIDIDIFYGNYNDMEINSDVDLSLVGITEVLDGDKYLHEFSPWE